MREVTKVAVKKVYTDNGFVYKKNGTGGFANVEVFIDAEHGGHGCLFVIHLPTVISINGGCFSGNLNCPQLDDVLDVLGKIGEDYHITRLRRTLQ